MARPEEKDDEARPVIGTRHWLVLKAWRVSARERRGAAGVDGVARACANPHPGASASGTSFRRPAAGLYVAPACGG